MRASSRNRSRMSGRWAQFPRAPSRRRRSAGRRRGRARRWRSRPPRYGRPAGGDRDAREGHAGYCAAGPAGCPGDTWRTTAAARRRRARPRVLARAPPAATGGPRASCWRAIQPRVHRICGRMLLYPEDAEEAAPGRPDAGRHQDRGFAGRSEFTTWLHAVTSNSARSTYRTLKRRAGRAHQRRAAQTPTRGRPA